MANIIEGEDPLFDVGNTSARERLENILTSRVIHASPMPFAPDNARAVCFTECVWDALYRLAQNYSAYGIVFKKRLIFDRGGAPALYIRGDQLNDLEGAIPQDLHPLISPFDPEAVLKPGVRLDWLYEREWRLPESLNFEYADIEFVLVDTIEDADEIVHLVGAQHLPEEKLIPLSVYKQIRQAWSPD